jgi:hypothetical protein
MHILSGISNFPCDNRNKSPCSAQKFPVPCEKVPCYGSENSLLFLRSWDGERPWMRFRALGSGADGRPYPALIPCRRKADSKYDPGGATLVLRRNTDCQR